MSVDSRPGVQGGASSRRGRLLRTGRVVGNRLCLVSRVPGGRLVRRAGNRLRSRGRGRCDGWFSVGFFEHRGFRRDGTAVRTTRVWGNMPALLAPGAIGGEYGAGTVCGTALLPVFSGEGRLAVIVRIGTHSAATGTGRKDDDGGQGDEESHETSLRLAENLAHFTYDRYNHYK